MRGKADLSVYLQLRSHTHTHKHTHICSKLLLLLPKDYKTPTEISPLMLPSREIAVLAVNSKGVRLEH